METIRSLLAKHTQLADSDTSRLDCEILLAFALQVDRSFLYTWPEKVVSKDALQIFKQLFSRRMKGEPIAYITGIQEFWSLPLKVNGSTLIPRPETELLVELALGLFHDDDALQVRQVLDLGTGSGAIALALASEKKHWQLLGLEKAAKACDLAEQNRKALTITNVQFAQSDWYSALDEGHRFDLIVSNPPYIESHDEHLQQGDVRFEPRSALVADNEGLSDIETIIQGATNYLRSGAYLLLEHGNQQADAVCALLREAGFSQVANHTDMARQPRVSLGCLE